MKAMVIRQYGDPSVMQLEDVAVPAVGQGEVLVRMYATSVNPFDLYRRSGAVKEQAPIAFPGVVGVDVAGIIQALEDGVDSFAVGESVLCMGAQTYAELCVVPAASLVRMPAGMDLHEAAAIPLVTTTGKMLAEATLPAAGRTILVTGAAGNVGRSAIYALKQAGAAVIAGVLASQLSDASVLGADRVIATDDAAAVEALEVLDAVADTVNGKLAATLITKVKAGGIFATVLGPPANAPQFPSVRCVSVYAVPDATVLAPMVEAVRNQTLQIPVARRYALQEAARAHEEVGKGAVHGKALLILDENAAATQEAYAVLKALLASYNDALNGSDTDKVLSLYTKDGIFMAPFSPSSIGSDAIREAYDRVFTTRRFDVAFHLQELVVLSPDSAYARTNSAGHTTHPETGIQSSEGNQELFVFRVEAGEWKIARYSFSPTGSSPA